jgi:hypothetical protein
METILEKVARAKKVAGHFDSVWACKTCNKVYIIAWRDMQFPGGGSSADWEHVSFPCGHESSDRYDSNRHWVRSVSEFE